MMCKHNFLKRNGSIHWLEAFQVIDELVVLATEVVPFNYQRPGFGPVRVARVWGLSIDDGLGRNLGNYIACRGYN